MVYMKLVPGPLKGHVDTVAIERLQEIAICQLLTFKRRPCPPDLRPNQLSPRGCQRRTIADCAPKRGSEDLDFKRMTGTGVTEQIKEKFKTIIVHFPHVERCDCTPALVLVVRHTSEHFLLTRSGPSGCLKKSPLLTDRFEHNGGPTNHDLPFAHEAFRGTATIKQNKLSLPSFDNSLQYVTATLNMSAVGQSHNRQVRMVVWR